MLFIQSLSCQIRVVISKFNVISKICSKHNRRLWNKLLLAYISILLFFFYYYFGIRLKKQRIFWLIFQILFSANLKHLSGSLIIRYTIFFVNHYNFAYLILILSHLFIKIIEWHLLQNIEKMLQNNKRHQTCVSKNFDHLLSYKQFNASIIRSI